MRITRWLLALMALLACGLIAAGCGDDDDESSSDEPATEESSDATSDESSEDSSSSDSAVDVDEFLSSCQEAFEGQPGEEIAADGCQQAADALEQCADAAEASGDDAAIESAVKACQETADQAVAALEASSGG